MQHRRLLCLTILGVLFGPDLRALPQRSPAPCDQYQAAVRTDPKNVEAAARLGRCLVRDAEMIALGGDSTRMVFRSSWPTALRALRHAVELDPGNSRAYRPLFRILFAEERDGCSSVTGDCRFVAPVLREGDSVVTVPRLVILNRPGLDTYEEVFRESQATRRANLTEARALAERWRAVAPNDPRPHEYLGQALLPLGDPVAATAELEYAATIGTQASRRALFWDRMEALVRADRGEEARRVLDEAVGDPGRDTSQLQTYTLPGLNALLGRYRLPPPDTSARARELSARMRAHVDSVIRTASSAPPPPRSPSFAALLAAADTIGARKELARLDSLRSPSQVQRFPQVDEDALFSAEQHLALGDTVGAEAQLSEIERPLNDRWFRYRVGMAYGPLTWVGRAWLLRATWRRRVDGGRRRAGCIVA